jgi:hypothetical protein
VKLPKWAFLRCNFSKISGVSGISEILGIFQEFVIFF